ncbi:hypothetical protein D3C73_927690 [compost metagenome]
MTKAEQCIKIFGELVTEHGDNFKVIRGQFIARAVAEAGCTPAGAATYYANCKNRGGATGDTRVRAENVEGYVPTQASGHECNHHDDRQMYSAIQKNKQGLVAHVTGTFHHEDAIKQAIKVRGLAVMGFPQLGEPVDSLQLITEESVANAAVPTCKCCAKL